MSTSSPSPRWAANQELVELIATLHTTEQRLEELTAGELDSVADLAGHNYLMRRAQEQLRSDQDIRQAAILNALPARVALIDPQGYIVTVNDTWRRFADANPEPGGYCRVGQNYLDHCDDPLKPLGDAGRRIARGLRALLAGTDASLSIEYSIAAAADDSWFLVLAAPMAGDRALGAVVMHLNITERKRSEADLHRLVGAINATTDAIYVVDRSSMRFVHVNNAACRAHDCTRAQLLALAPWEVFATTSAALALTYDAVIDSDQSGTAPVFQSRVTSRAEACVELRHHAQRTGNRWAVVTYARDVTERRAAEASIALLSRMNAMLSRISMLVVRAGDRDDLYEKACRMAVEEGGFSMCLLCTVDRGATGIVPVAWAGKDEQLAGAVKALLASPRAPLTMLARAVRDRAAVVANDSRNDAQVLISTLYSDNGIRSIAVIPLIVAGAVVGVLALYSAARGTFGPSELELLTRLADDLAFGIDYIDKQERLNFLAYYDELTGLANRNLFIKRVAQHIELTAAGTHRHAVVLINLERFKNINDSLGWQAGDALLKQMAEWLTHNLAGVEQVARVGADHFAVFLPDSGPASTLVGLIEGVVEKLLKQPFYLNDAVLRIAARFGVALFPDDGADADTLFKNAESALKRAKTSGERYLFYAPQMNVKVAGQLTLESQLREALEREEFVLHYQPKINLVSGALTGAEALIRWNDPRTGLVPPARFIPILEDTGLINEVGRWAVRKATADYLGWRAAGLAAVRIAVNVSAVQLRHRGFIDEIRDAIAIHADAAAGLELEITESLIMEDIELSIKSLQAIRAMGVRTAIDDFGTGFSSLSYLSKLPVDTLKIDRSFISDMSSSEGGLALMTTIITLAHALMLNVVAEGVETEEQMRLLRLINCNEMQGYVIDKPMPRELFETKYLTHARQGAAPNRAGTSYSIW